jgi:hypothetical protein
MLPLVIVFQKKFGYYIKKRRKEKKEREKQKKEDKCPTQK